MSARPRPPNPTDAAEAILSLCREIAACGKSLSEETDRSRSRLQKGADLGDMKPDLLTQAERAARLQALVASLKKGLREFPVSNGRLEEVRRAVEGAKIDLARLAEKAGEACAIASRKGFRIPGVGGRPYPRKRS